MLSPQLFSLLVVKTDSVLSDLQNCNTLPEGRDFSESPTTIQGHLYSLSACHTSINNLPNAVGCLCVSTDRTELSVTGTGCSSLCDGWALFDRHVKLSQIHVNGCRAEDRGNHSNDVAGTSFTVAQIKSKLWFVFSSSLYYDARHIPKLVLYLFCLHVFQTTKSSWFQYDMIYNTVDLWIIKGTNIFITTYISKQIHCS